uniref:Uncharacterized protein n=1 Tax=Oryza punctata TaxID=4537 RepID=A0A0E0KIE0_ORYPU
MSPTTATTPSSAMTSDGSLDPLPPRSHRGGLRPPPRRQLAIASRAPESDLIRAFRGGATPTSSAAVEAGILVDPSAAHRLIAVFVGTKFGDTDDVLSTMRTAVFKTSSDSATVAVACSGEVQWRRWSPLAMRLSSTGGGGAGVVEAGGGRR